MRQLDGEAEVDINSVYAAKAANAIIVVVAAAILVVAGVREIVIRDVEKQTAIFSQLARDCLKGVLEDSGVVNGVRRPLNAEETSAWRSCVEQGKADQWLYMYPSEPGDEALASAIQAVENGK